MKLVRNFDVYKKLAIFAFLAAVIYFMCTHNNNNTGVEGLSPNDAATTTVADADPDLKCPGSAADPTKCTTVDLMKLAYDIASDPRTSVTELDAISKVCESRKLAGYESFHFDALMLRAATMYNTTANETTFKSILDDMTKNKKQCYSNDYMKSVKGLLVGSKDELTLTVAQSEALRCYAHRINAFKKCLNGCK